MPLNLKEKKRSVIIVLLITLLLNLISSSVKIFCGIHFDYLSLTSSGFESLFDGASNILGFISITMALRPADSDHPYGHMKYETIGSLIIALLLILSSYQLGKQIFANFGHDDGIRQFEIIPFLAILLSMSVSRFCAWYELKKGKELGSPILIADAKHTYGDFIISFGVIISLLSTALGWGIVDQVVGALICGYLAYLAIDIVRANLPALVDATPVEIDHKVIEKISQIPGVSNIHKFRMRGTDQMLYVDFHMWVDGDTSLRHAHNLASQAEMAVKEHYKNEVERIDITVHVEPSKQSSDQK